MDETKNFSRGGTVDKDGCLTLSEEIKEMGLMNPLLVRPLGDGTLELVAGFRRYFALVLGGFKTAQCKVWELTDVEAAHLNMTENMERLELTLNQEVQMVRDSYKRGNKNAHNIAKDLGRAFSWVKPRLYLTKVSKEISDSAYSGVISLKDVVDICEQFQSRWNQTYFQNILKEISDDEEALIDKLKEKASQANRKKRSKFRTRTQIDSFIENLSANNLDIEAMLLLWAQNKIDTPYLHEKIKEKNADYKY